MTPKEKAKDLVCTFYAIQSDEYNYGINWTMAKQCALIAASEATHVTGSKYWYNVKHEIQKL